LSASGLHEGGEAARARGHRTGPALRGEATGPGRSARRVPAPRGRL